MNVFEQIINVLVVGAIGLTVVKSYLTANKVWSRKHKKDVSESVSVSAQLIGLFTSLPFLIKYTFIDGDFMSLANMSIKLGLTIFFLMIGIGVWVRVDGRENLWTKVKRSLKLEKKESLDLIHALTQPAGAPIILDVLQKLAGIDKKLDDREKAFIQQFADRWDIKIDFKEEFDLINIAASDELHIDLRDRLADYIAITPDREQATQFLDIIDSLIGVDEEVSEEEEFILGEIKGMIETYISGGDAETSFNVIVVPQDREERAIISTLLPNVNPREEAGGKVYYAGTFYSRSFAEMISEKYQKLNLFSFVKAMRTHTAAP